MLPQLCLGGAQEKHPFLLGGLREHLATVVGDLGGAVGGYLKPLAPPQTNAWSQKERHLATEANVVCRLLRKRKRVPSPGGTRGKRSCSHIRGDTWGEP